MHILYIFIGQFIRVTGQSNVIPILNSNNSVGHLTQVNEVNQYHYLHALRLWRFWNTQRNFSIVYQNVLHLYQHKNSINTMINESQGILVYEN